MPKGKKRKHCEYDASKQAATATTTTPAKQVSTATSTSAAPSPPSIGTSLTSALFGNDEPSLSDVSAAAHNHCTDLFSSPEKFNSAVKDRIDSNIQKQQQKVPQCNRRGAREAAAATDATQEEQPKSLLQQPQTKSNCNEASSRASILSRRKRQASLPFLNQVTSTAPNIAIDCKNTQAQDDDNDDDNDDADETIQIPPDVRAQEIADIVKLHGFAIVKKVFSKNLLNQLALRADEIEQQVCKRLDEKGIIEWRSDVQVFHKAINVGGEPAPRTFCFCEVASRCKGRMDVRYRMKEPPFSSPSVLENKSLKQIVDSLLGGGVGGRVTDASYAPVLVYAGLILSFASSNDQPWHQDGMPLFPELCSSSISNVSMLPPYAINVFVPLTDFDGSIEAGPTEFIPGSHVMDEEAVLQSVGDYCDEKQSFSETDASFPEKRNVELPGIVSPILKQGDALLYDYRVCHRGTSNLAYGGKTRRVLYLMYARPWFKEHLNFGSERLFHDASNESLAS